jgi:hypothetical protein
LSWGRKKSVESEGLKVEEEEKVECRKREVGRTLV